MPLDQAKLNAHFDQRAGPATAVIEEVFHLVQANQFDTAEVFMLAAALAASAVKAQPEEEHASWMKTFIKALNLSWTLPMPEVLRLKLRPLPEFVLPKKEGDGSTAAS